MDDYTSKNVVNDVIHILQNRSGVKEIVDHNYNLVKRFYAYANLKRKPGFILNAFFGAEWEQRNYTSEVWKYCFLPNNGVWFARIWILLYKMFSFRIDAVS